MEADTGVALEELATLTGGRPRSRGGVLIRRVARLQDAGEGDITFLANSRYRSELAATRASAVIVSPADADAVAGAVIIHDNPYAAFARISAHLNPEDLPPPGVAETACVAPDAALGDGAAVAAGAVVGAGARIGAGSVIGANTVVGDGAVVGRDCRLMANVTLYPGVRLGDRVRVHAGTVIGSDGFGFANDGGRWVRVPQLGSVVIGDDVDIGANTAIDCGTLGDTVIEDGVKIDNLVQIAHNVRVGAHTVMAGCSGVAGSTTLGPGCTIAGMAGVAGHLEVAGGTVVTGMSWVTHDVREPGVYSSGTPMAPNAQWRRNAARFNQLDGMARRIRKLERLVERLTDEQDNE